MTVAAVAVLVAAGAAGAEPVDFQRDVYPIFERHNCRACHNASGVASGSRLQAPEDSSSDRAIEAFSYALIRLVDRQKPLESALLLKPTNRVEHTGGALIAPGSEEEAVWIRWIQRLAETPDAEARAARLQASLARSSEPLRRLTHLQYNNTVRDLLGDKTRPAGRFPGEDFVNGYLNQAEAQSITPLLAEAYSHAAERLARGAFRFGDQQGLIPCEPQGPADAACAARFVTDFGRKAFRRPLSVAERESFAELLLTEAGKRDSFLAGAQLVVEAMLQAPDFLFLIERAESATKGYETAARLSYLLWSTMPDEELFRAAEDGGSRTPPKWSGRCGGCWILRARRALDELVAQWLRFDRALGTVKDAVKYKDFTPQVAEAMTEETRLLFGHGLERPRLPRAFHGPLHLREQFPDNPVRPPRTERAVRARGLSGGLRPRRRVGAWDAAGPNGQARRDVADRARALCPGALPLSGGAAAAAGRQCVVAAPAGRRPADDDARGPRRAAHQGPFLCELPPAGRPDRLRV